MSSSPNGSPAGAVCLRGWALELLARDPAALDPERRGRIAAQSAETWALFLRSERCALALQARLADAAPIADAPGGTLRAASTRELQRVLSARGQLRAIGGLAAAHGIKTIVLKGGLSALTNREPTDLADVDVLVPPEQAALLSRLLDSSGYRALAAGSVAHLAARIPSNGVQVEVHFAIRDVAGAAELRERARPLPDCRGLWRLSPADHLWHLLIHSVVTHPHRRGCLRDVLLIRQAAAECATSELDEVRRRFLGHPHARPLSSALDFALSLRPGRPGPGPDPFLDLAAANYLLQSHARSIAGSRLLQPAVGTVFVLLGERADRRVEWAEAWRTSPWRSRWKLLVATERAWPWLGRTCRRVARVARVALARLLLRPIAGRARRLAKQAQGGGCAS